MPTKVIYLNKIQSDASRLKRHEENRNFHIVHWEGPRTSQQNSYQYRPESQLTEVLDSQITSLGRHCAFKTTDLFRQSRQCDQIKLR